jgi:hypothetical protein
VSALLEQAWLGCTSTTGPKRITRQASVLCTSMSRWAGCLGWCLARCLVRVPTSQPVPLSRLFFTNKHSQTTVCAFGLALASWAWLLGFFYQRKCVAQNTIARSLTCPAYVSTPWPSQVHDVISSLALFHETERLFTTVWLRQESPLWSNRPNHVATTINLQPSTLKASHPTAGQTAPTHQPNSSQLDRSNCSEATTSASPKNTRTVSSNSHALDISQEQ